MKIDWHDIQESAPEIFEIWTDGSELGWAQDAWSKLDFEGLTSYENDLGKHIVIVRLLTLGTLYHEFCQFAFEEMAIIDYFSWIELLNDEELFLSSFRLGQLLGPEFMSEEEIFDDHTEQLLLSESIGSLIEQQRAIVVTALVNGFGGESLLFAHLWLSSHSLDKEEDFDDEDGDIYYENNSVETVEDVLTNLTSDKMVAFEWITSGMLAIQTYLDSKPCPTCIKDLIKDGESEIVEFKERFCSNIREGKKDKEIMNNILRTVVAFMNSNGGHLLIGVSDDGSIIGIEQEYSIVNPQKCDKDGFQLCLDDLLINKIDNELVHFLYKIKFHSIDGKEICEVLVRKSPKPAFLNENFYIRQSNRNIELKGRKLLEHTRYMKEVETNSAQ